MQALPWYRRIERYLRRQGYQPTLDNRKDEKYVKFSRVGLEPSYYVSKYGEVFYSRVGLLSESISVQQSMRKRVIDFELARYYTAQR